MQHEAGLGIFMRKLCFARGRKKVCWNKKVADVENMFLVFNAARTIFQPCCSLNVISTVIRSAEDEKQKLWPEDDIALSIRLIYYCLVCALRKEAVKLLLPINGRREISWKDLTCMRRNFPSEAKTKKKFLHRRKLMRTTTSRPHWAHQSVKQAAECSSGEFMACVIMLSWEHKSEECDDRRCLLVEANER